MGLGAPGLGRDIRLIWKALVFVEGKFRKAQTLSLEG